MVNYPKAAVKKFTKPAHREIAVGILIAYGLFPRTNEGIAAAERLIAGRETWLAPSGLPNYYNDIESDLMTGRETAGIRYIRNALKDFYGLTEGDKSESKLTIPNNNTTVYKPEDKFVDDVQEKLEKKLEETSDKMMDVVDALIEQQNRDFEEFKRKQQEELEAKRKAREGSSDQYSEPAGPPEPPVQGPKEPPKKTVAPEKDEDWESEVPDQLGTKLDELIEQVQNDPLPQPSKTKRRKTKGKKTLERKSARMDAREMGVGASLTEIMQNVIETREALFDLYKVTKERFEFKKKIDKRLTASLEAKLREKTIEGSSGEGDSSNLLPPGDKEKDKKKKKKKNALEKSLIDGLVGGAIMMTLPLVIEGLRPFFDKDSEKKGDNQWWDFLDLFPNEIKKDLDDEKALKPTPEEPTSIADQSGGLGTPDPQPEGSTSPVQPQEQQEAPPAAPAAPSMPLGDTSIPGDPDYRKPEPIPLRSAAKGGNFVGGKHKPLRPISTPPINNTAVKKLTKPLSSVVTLPQKVASAGVLSFANNIVSPFSAFLPDSGKQFIQNIFRGIADSAGLSGMKLDFGQSANIFDKIKKFIDNILNSLLGISPSRAGELPPGGGPSGGPGGEVSVTDDEEEYLMRLMIAEAGGEGKVGMAAVAKSVMNRAGLIQSGKVGAGTFLADSGSVKDVINAPGQYQPVAQGKLNRNLSDEERKRAREALSLARSDGGMRDALKAEGMSEDQIKKIMASTGFRTRAARDDASQNVNTTQLGNHVFNTAGNAGMLSLGANIEKPKMSGLTPTDADKAWYDMMTKSGKSQTEPPSASPRRNLLQQMLPQFFPPPAAPVKPEMPAASVPTGRRAPQQPGS